MNSLQLVTRIKSRIEDLADLHANFFNGNKSLSNLEKEVFKRNCEELYDMILKLKTADYSANTEPVNDLPTPKVNQFTDLFSSSNNPIQTSNTEVEPLNTVTNANEPMMEMNMNEKTFKETVIETAAELTLDELGSSYEAEIPMEEELIQPVMEEIPFPTEKTSNKPELKIGRTVMPEIPKAKEEPKVLSIEKIILPDTERLNDKLKEKSITSDKSFIEPRIENLKTAITLNRKIAFVNELFKENVVEYAKAIEKLNTSIDRDEAMNYFHELKSQHAWENANALVSELESLVERRYRN